MNLQLVPAVSWPVFAVIACLCLLPGLLAAALRARGSWIRLAATVSLLAVLAGPHWLTHTTTALPDTAIILVDQSQSMGIGTRSNMTNKALAALRATAGTTQLLVADIPPAQSGGTSLMPSLQQALANTTPAQLAGIVIITDGEVADAQALPHNVPISALITANGEETDRELRLINAPAYGLVAHKVNLVLQVIDHGVNDAGTSANLTISEDGTVVANTVVIIGEPQTVALAVPHDGPCTVTATVTPLPGAVTTLNNIAAFTLNGIQKRLNVLLISGAPNQGERAWRLLLKSDPAVQLVHFTILRNPGEELDADPQDIALVPFPVRELFQTDINKFNLIILDSFNAQDLLPDAYFANIATYVQNGGALLVETGPEFDSPASLAYSSLAPVLPAAPSGQGTLYQTFSPKISALGARHPVTAPFANAQLPSWYRMEVATPVSGDILMTGANDLPLLILADAGKGRTGILLSDQLWLWTRGGNHQGPALPLLRRIVHWLLREPALEADSLSANITGGLLTVTRQTTAASYPGNAIITEPDATQQAITLKPLTPGIYSATRPAMTPGVSKITEGGFTTYAANVDPNTEEFQDLAATATNFQNIASNIIWLGKTPTPNLMPLISRRHARGITGTRSVPILPPVPALIGLLALIAFSWWRESLSK